MSSISQVSADRVAASHSLELDGNNRSQWLPAASYRSAFCAAVVSVSADWSIEALLPSGGSVEVGSYTSGILFEPSMPRYITTNAMCGLPIRFVSSVPQSNSQLWVVFKS